MEALNLRKSELRSHIAACDDKLRQLERKRNDLEGGLRDLRGRTGALAKGIAERNASQSAQNRTRLKRSPTKWLVSSTTLDSGSVALFWNRIEFKGWRGNCVINLSEVGSINQRTSRLPARSGIPLLGRWFPGHVREGDTLLVELSSGATSARRAVLAALPHGSNWQQALKDAISDIPRIEAERREAAAQVQELEQQKAGLDTQMRDLKSQMTMANSEIRKVQETRRRAEHELALPDWEYRTIQLKGKNLQRSLEAQLRSSAAQGWELSSTASPRKDELVATLKRVRRL